MATRTSEQREVVFLSPRRLDRIQAVGVDVATSQEQVLKTLQRERASTVWVERGNEGLLGFLVKTLACTTEKISKSCHMLLTLSALPAHQSATFESLFARVVSSLPNALPPHELADALRATHSADLCVGGFVDEKAGIVTLMRGNLEPLVVPLDSFEPTPGDGETPDFSRFSVRDSGQTVAFGDYEASFDAVLYEQDKAYRRRKRQESLKADASLGGSIRRLRKQHRLSRAEFQDVPERTLARIERGEVAHPQQRTLQLIAKTLRVPVDELDSY